MWSNVSECCIKIVHQIIRRKSVLYVCEKVNNRNTMTTGGVETSSHGYPTVRPNQQHDITLGYPIQVSFPDGETINHHYNTIRIHNGGPEQEAELTRGYIKAPENKSLSDLETSKLYGDLYSFHKNHFPSKMERGRRKKNCKPLCKKMTSMESPQQSASFTHYHLGNVSSLASSSSSITSGWSSSATEEGTCSPRRGRKMFPQKNVLPILLAKGGDEECGRILPRSCSTYGDRSTEETFQPHQGSVDHSQALLPYPSTATTLADLAVVTCGTASLPRSQECYSFRASCSSLQSDYSCLDRYVEVPESAPFYKSVCRSSSKRTDNEHI